MGAKMILDSMRALPWGCRKLLQAGVFLGLLASQLAGAVSLGPATVEAVQSGRFSVAIPIVPLPGGVGPAEAGASGAGLCEGRACQEVSGRLERSDGGAGWMLRVDGRALPGKQYAEFQAWVAWDGDGRQRGYVKLYKIALPSGSAASLQSGEQPADSTPAAEVAGPSQELSRLVNDWAAAWSRKDMGSYLSFYAGDFETPRGLTRDAWERERHQRIAGRAGYVQVTCLTLRTDMVADDLAKVQCLQQYRSATFASVGDKTLWLGRRPGGWRIIRETIDGERRVEQAQN